MTPKKNVWLSALAEVVRMHPKLSAGIAFELGVVAASAIRSVRLRKSLDGATAKLIEAVPMMSSVPAPRAKAKRKPAARKRKAVKRAKVVAQDS